MSYPEAPAASDPAPARDRAAGDEDARLFLALWPDPALRARLCRRRDAWRWPPGARPVPDERLHLTLHYIGAFARRNVTALGNSLAAVSIEPTTLRALDEEVWRGGVAVLRLAGDPALAALHGRLGAVLAELGVALDPRPFSPHVTLARRARGAEPPRDLPGFEWRAGGFALVESLRAPGAGYLVLRNFDAAAS